MTKYRIYHDESQVGGFWHGILLIPEEERAFILDSLQDLRNAIKFDEPISLKKSLKKRKKRYTCTKLWIDFAYYCLQQKTKNTNIGIVYFPQKIVSKDNSISTCYKPIIEFSRLVKIKFSLFYLPGTLKSLKNSYYFDYASKFETTYRMCLKWACHYFFSQDDEMQIKSLHFDNHRHLGRRINRERIIDRLTHELNHYASFSDDVFIEDDSSDHRLDESQSYDDCQFLQLTDLLISGFRTILWGQTNSDHREVCDNIGKLANKWNRGPIGFRNSRWFNGFSISQGSLNKTGNWEFENYIIPECRRSDQITLSL